MSQWQSQVLALKARSCYHGYIADFVTNGRLNNRLAYRAEECLVKSVLEISEQRPTKADLLVEFLAMIIEVEAEWPEGTQLPTRPHDL